MDIKNYLQTWAASYREDLTRNILPFWMEHGLDRTNGGVYTCVGRDGSLIDTTKSVWFQGRFGFIAAYAYNHIERNPEWLAASRSCIDFIEQHCTDTDGRMYFEVTAEGTPLRKRRYVFSETFAAIAMSEYAIASGDKTYAEKALTLFRQIRRWLSTPGVLEPKYLPTLQSRGHSITMILINTASRIREMVGPNGEFIDTCNGRLINPGHCIETSWFLLEEARLRNWDKDLTDLALQILDWSWDWGWDKAYGGLINFRDCRNLPVQDYSQDMKFWWPQCEAIIASLYAYLATRDEKYILMHKMASDWTYAHFPDPEYGEWYGYLHRDGTVAQPAKGNIFKGPFHIPRMMMYAYGLCNDICATL